MLFKRKRLQRFQYKTNIFSSIYPEILHNNGTYSNMPKKYHLANVLYKKLKTHFYLSANTIEMVNGHIVSE